MMKLIKKILTTLTFAVLIAAPAFTVVSPQAAFAGAKCEIGILGMPVWFRGLTDDECNIVDPSSLKGGLPTFIWSIVLNIIEIGLFIAGYAALFFVIYGGFLYLTGGGNASQTEKARKTLLNAVIGLVISIASIGAINLLFGIING